MNLFLNPDKIDGQSPPHPDPKPAPTTVKTHKIRESQIQAQAGFHTAGRKA